MDTGDFAASIIQKLVFSGRKNAVKLSPTDILVGFNLASIVPIQVSILAKSHLEQVCVKLTLNKCDKKPLNTHTYTLKNHG